MMVKYIKKNPPATSNTVHEVFFKKKCIKKILSQTKIHYNNSESSLFYFFIPRPHTFVKYEVFRVKKWASNANRKLYFREYTHEKYFFGQIAEICSNKNFVHLILI